MNLHTKSEKDIL